MTKSSSNNQRAGNRTTSTSARKAEARRRASKDQAAPSITKPGKLDKAVRELMGEDKPHED